MRLIRMKQVLEKTGKSRTTIWRDIKTGEFPQPVSIGARSIAFVEQEVDDWIKLKVESRTNKKVIDWKKLKPSNEITIN